MDPHQSNQVSVEDIEFYPASPTSEYINSSVLSLSILSVFESEIPIDDSQTITLLRTDFLPINPRFSAILLRDEKGSQIWKKVHVKLEDHVKTPHFPLGLHTDAYDEYLKDYLSKIAGEKLPDDRPLWEIHIFKYPTRDAAGTTVFKLHHALGDGFSLMGALFSCLRRADDPSMPLTFPSSFVNKESITRRERVKKIWRGVRGVVTGCWNTANDFSTGLLQSTVWEDDRNAIRSGRDGVEFEPISVSTVTFSLDDIRKVKHQIGGTVNDVAVGTLFYGIQLYKQRTCQNSNGTRMTALVLLNTRMVSSYQNINEMLRQKTWGNQFTFLNVRIPSTNNTDKPDPLSFLLKAKKTIKRKKHSMAIFLTGRLLHTLRRFKGPEAVSSFIHTTMKNTSTGISYLNGPIEKMELGCHPIKSFYFLVVGVPHSLAVTMVSYMGTLKVVLTGEKGFIDSQLLVSCMKEAFDKVYREACGKDEM
ncbi:hypothetical protein MRB53_001146 [Persea americana]|uniref:Uncharacterized protein n=1 Tax=Persea americana TaxID=3435 RepID=A0ACC2MRJ9_PERAE|nr:hypothetical protein MRB53_001146 [Persea americana]|eukprot:TRINITY_DN23962_c1_g2_i1.p1 TRINITY_DN23962_c1_g2~~TRINITY_DN23962_c1_g2_i1.p1  ORF type:complete len:484 (+),score=76.28 TRINITY_DN23962_c1_g2_i1:26-1453(+)